MNRRIYRSNAERQRAYRERQCNGVASSATPAPPDRGGHAAVTAPGSPLTSSWSVLDLAEAHGWPSIVLSDGQRIGAGAAGWLDFTAVAGSNDLSAAVVALRLP